MEVQWEVKMFENSDDKTVNAEKVDFEASLQDISRELRPGETLILDIGNNYFHQADEIFDTLVLQGFDVRKSFKNGRNQVVVSRKPDRG